MLPVSGGAELVSSGRVLNERLAVVYTLERIAFSICFRRVNYDGMNQSRGSTDNSPPRNLAPVDSAFLAVVRRLLHEVAGPAMFGNA